MLIIQHEMQQIPISMRYVPHQMSQLFVQHLVIFHHYNTSILDVLTPTILFLCVNSTGLAQNAWCQT